MKQQVFIFALLITIMMMISSLYAQSAPIDFETGGHGANWTWTVFENATNPPVEIIANPDASGNNTSASVAKFTALVGGQPWAGCESQHGSDIGTFTFNSTNCTVKIMVHKPVISDVGIKFASASGASTGEIKVANTLINQWEELVFDFSGRIGETNDQIIVFPDFNLAGRTTDNVCYFDNITFSEQIAIDMPEAPAPTPTYAAANVISLYSNAYDNVTIDTWSASWDSADVQDVQINGNDTKLYTNLVFAGIEFTSNPIDASDMTHFCMDIWTPDATAMPAEFKIKLVDFGADGAWGGGDDTEHELAFNAGTNPPLVSSSWIRFNIPLTDFVGMTGTGSIAQLIISGTPNTVYVDNILFRQHTTSVEDQTNTTVPARLGNSYPNPFTPFTNISYEISKAANVSLKIYDVKGRLVDTLVDGFLEANNYRQAWQAASASSGIYFYQLQVNGQIVDTKRMMLVK